MASSQKMVGKMISKMSQMRGVGATPEAKWVPAQVMVSKEPRWVPEEISVPRDALQQQDTSTALVNPLPKERWNSTAASCSSNTIGPLCSDVIEKNWDFFAPPSFAGYDQKKINLGHFHKGIFTVHFGKHMIEYRRSTLLGTMSFLQKKVDWLFLQKSCLRSIC